MVQLWSYIWNVHHYVNSSSLVLAFFVSFVRKREIIGILESSKTFSLSMTPPYFMCYWLSGDNYCKGVPKFAMKE